MERIERCWRTVPLNRIKHIQIYLHIYIYIYTFKNKKRKRESFPVILRISTSLYTVIHGQTDGFPVVHALVPRGRDIEIGGAPTAQPLKLSFTSAVEVDH